MIQDKEIQQLFASEQNRIFDKDGMEFLTMNYQYNGTWQDN